MWAKRNSSRAAAIAAAGLLFWIIYYAVSGDVVSFRGLGLVVLLAAPFLYLAVLVELDASFSAQRTLGLGVAVAGAPLGASLLSRGLARVFVVIVHPIVGIVVAALAGGRPQPPKGRV